MLSNRLDNLPSSWCLSGVGVEPQVRVTKSSAKLVKFQFYLCWLFYVLRIESVWCIVRGLFSFVGTQSPFFLDQKSKACWRWTKKMAKWSNREREWAYLSTIHTAPGLLVLALSLFGNEREWASSQEMKMTLYVSGGGRRGEKEIISWHTAKARLAVRCSTIIQRPMSNPYYTRY